MRKLLLALAFSAAALGGAQAADVDMSKVTCKDVAAMEPAKVIAFGMWMSGFVAGKSGTTMVDTDKAMTNAQAMGDYCTKNPDATVMSAVESMMKS